MPPASAAARARQDERGSGVWIGLSQFMARAAAIPGMAVGEDPAVLGDLHGIAEIPVPEGVGQVVEVIHPALGEEHGVDRLVGAPPRRGDGGSPGGAHDQPRLIDRRRHAGASAQRAQGLEPPDS